MPPIKEKAAIEKAVVAYTRCAVRHLRAADPVLAKLILRVGPCTLAPDRDLEIFDALVRSIVYQQLNGKAAATILGRVRALFPGGKPKPKALLAMADDPLRGAGLSANKLLALRDLSAKTLEGVVPTQAAAAEMSDAELIERLVEVRGIGVWTVHMLLIFRLGRPDVLPTGDFAIRKAYGLLYRKRGHPTPQAVEKHGRLWSPYRTVASWYLWRSLDEIR